ncbi:Protein phosphatase 1 regulatory subunit 7 [Zea mays]|uniref:Protein phosphatase 1 regulatory subunit 7 n=1 Tax=Zea mays TaxID=4577 RepID=A0A3L6FKD7_MAIZE|nr:Protein phosphatase 1 regulatory subunit 7 [Zea mays]
MGRLTEEQAAREAGSVGTNATSLKLTHRALSDVSCLSSFKNLEHLDLGFNCLVTLEGLSSCANLKWLSVKENKLVSLKGVEGLSKLQVLNAGKNELTKMDEVTSLTSLGALILNDNNISSICKLDQLQQLNTLVLSKNPVFTIGNALVKAKSMKKLSLSHCQIENIGSSLVKCVELKELRLSHNKISTIPSDLAKNVKILNLDLGNNFIERSSDLKVLSELRYLRNLNLQGNPVSKKDSLVKKVKKSVPTLRILNAKPLEATSKSDTRSTKENPPSKDEDPIGIDAKKDKRKGSKQEVKGLEELEVQSVSTGITTSNPGKLEVPDGKEKKKVKEAKTKKSEEPYHANNSSLKNKEVQSFVYDTSTKDKKEAKRKKFVDEEDVDAEGIDNTEISFADLMFSNVGNPETKLKNISTLEAAPDGKSVGGLVIDHTKKRKKPKGVVTITDSSALKMFSSMPEVGAGGLGLSGWDE